MRVSNLSEDVKDSDLRELFRRFGAIQRIYLAKDRDTRASRGFAFINFFARDDAQRRPPRGDWKPLTLCHPPLQKN